MKVRSSKYKVHTFAAFCLCVSAVMVQAQTGAPFDLSHNVIASGGGRSTATLPGRSFSIEGTIGQGFAGRTSSSTTPQFSVEGGFWGFRTLLPTATTVGVSGRVLSSQGRGVGQARVIITSAAGIRQTATTNVFGFYRFDEVEVGETYIVNVLIKRFEFTPRVISVNDEITGLDFVAMVN